MKYLKIYLFLFICSFLSCSKDTDENKSFLTINPTNLTINVEAEACNRFYTVTSDKIIKVASDNPDWCSPVLSNVSIDNLKITISKNETFQNRKSVVTVSNGSENIHIKVSQAAEQAILSVNKNSVSVQFGEAQFKLEITSNVRIYFELPGWIKEKEGNIWQEGKKEYAFTLSALPDELSYREGTIIIRAEDESLLVKPVSVFVTQKAIPKIIAHRGCWQTPNYPQNSLASLQRAIDLGIYGSELDVWITKDGVAVLNHDPTINGINIENSNYSALKDARLSNGEPIPTLADCIDIVKRQKQTKLIMEIKPHSTTENENRAVETVLKLVNDNKVTDLVDYISFSQNICRGLIANNPKNRVAYLNGNIDPETLKTEGYWGLDYSSSILKINSTWVQIARNLELKTNVWTVNTTADFEYFISMGVDFITTDYPHNLKELLESYKFNKSEFLK